MNINVNIKNERKLGEKLRWYTYKIICKPAAYCPRLLRLVPNLSGDISI